MYGDRLRQSGIFPNASISWTQLLRQLMGVVNGNRDVFSPEGRGVLVGKRLGGQLTPTEYGEEQRGEGKRGKGSSPKTSLGVVVVYFWSGILCKIPAAKAHQSDATFLGLLEYTYRGGRCSYCIEATSPRKYSCESMRPPVFEHKKRACLAIQARANPQPGLCCTAPQGSRSAQPTCAQLAIPPLSLRVGLVYVPMWP